MEAWKEELLAKRREIIRKTEACAPSHTQMRMPWPHRPRSANPHLSGCSKGCGLCPELMQLFAMIG